MTAALVFACAMAAVAPRRAHAAAADAPSPATASPPPGETREQPPPGTTPASSGAAPAPVGPMTPEAQALYDRGLELFRTRDFQGAVRVLERGFAVEPRREFLFAEAQALRLAGDCARAIPLYQRFIDLGAPPVQAEAARLGLDRCAPERAPPAGGPQPAAGPSAAPPPNPGPGTLAAPGGAPGFRTGAPAPTTERPIWWRDPLVLASAGLGVAALGIGTAAWVASDRWADQAQSPRTTTEPEFDRLWNMATDRRELAIVSLAVGAGLLAAGGVRALWLHNRPAAAGLSSAMNPLMPSFLPSRGGGSVSWEGRF